MSNFLSQEEIDAMLNQVASTAVADVTELEQTEKDIIGEVGNISMSQAATTLSALLNQQVKITTPQVSQLTLKAILEESDYPKVVTSIDFKTGLTGSNMLMIDINDAIIIADLMMGNDGTDVADKEFGELELSAVGEAMNQMIGTAATAMATMFDKTVDILPPQVQVLEMNKSQSDINTNDETPIVAISFELQVEGLIDSTILQLYTEETVDEIIQIMLNDEAEVIQNREVFIEEPIAKAVVEEPMVADRKVEIQKPVFQSLTNQGTMDTPRNLDLIMDVPLELSVVLGKSRRTIKDILSLGVGSVVELEKMTDEPLDILVNGKIVAQGEVVVINESFGIRITNILSKEKRILNIND